MSSEIMSIEAAAEKLPPCPLRCSDCPSEGHHWMLDNDWSDDGENEDTVRISCKHCDTSMFADIDDPNLPEI